MPRYWCLPQVFAITLPPPNPTRGHEINTGKLTPFPSFPQIQDRDLGEGESTVIYKI
jgi:hypothetical protein